MHILHTVLFTFPNVLAGRISLTIKRVLILLSFILMTVMLDSGIKKEKLDASHSQEF